MNSDERILEELRRFNYINSYIMEQDAPPPPPEGDLPPPPAGDPAAAGGTPPPPAGDPAAAEGAPPPPAPPVDVATDAEVTKVDDDGKEEGKENEESLDITDLVDTQKSIQDKQDEYFENLFSQLTSLENKLASMDELVSKIDKIESDLEKYRPKTATEKLELRSLDSGPFNQKLSDFFQDKMEDIEKSGKNEYVLTADDVKDYSPSEIEGTFQDYEDSEEDTDNM
jgi:hypothetical protein